MWTPLNVMLFGLMSPLKIRIYLLRDIFISLHSFSSISNYFRKYVKK